MTTAEKAEHDILSRPRSAISCSKHKHLVAGQQTGHSLNVGQAKSKSRASADLINHGTVESHPNLQQQHSKSKNEDLETTDEKFKH